jgi:hypothetical protein
VTPVGTLTGDQLQRLTSCLRTVALGCRVAPTSVAAVAGLRDPHFLAVLRSTWKRHSIHVLKLSSDSISGSSALILSPEGEVRLSYLMYASHTGMYLASFSAKVTPQYPAIYDSLARHVDSLLAERHFTGTLLSPPSHLGSST